MSNNVVIALDAMGGDDAPIIVIDGDNIALKKLPNVSFKIFGDANVISPLLKAYPKLLAVSEIVHTTHKILNEDKPAEALRNGRESSMRLAINSVKDLKCHAVVSAGNTGALMAMSKFVLNTIPGISRPAITTMVPTRKQPCVLLDLGANSECSKEQLIQFAFMGDAFAKTMLNIDKPRIGLLNIGSEALKGNSLVQETSELLTSYPHINYVGFAEGNDIFQGNFDVIVTDGFTGNIALKVLEGTASFIKYKILNIFTNSIFSFLPKIGFIFLYLFSFWKINRIKNEIDPRNYNGAMLIGLNGISVKSHGGADKKSFASAINVAYQLILGDVNKKIQDELQENKK